MGCNQAKALEPGQRPYVFQDFPYKGVLPDHEKAFIQNQKYQKDQESRETFDAIPSILKHSSTITQYTQLEKQLNLIFESCDHNVETFVTQIQEKVAKIYEQTCQQILENMKSNETLTQKSKVNISQKILSINLGILRVIGSHTDYKYDYSIFKILNQFQKKLAGYLKTKYPRGAQRFVPGQLMNVFKEYDQSNYIENDILKNSETYFDDNQDLKIARRIKEFVNKVIDELDVQFPRFESLMRDKIFNIGDKNLDYKIGRKIPQTVPKYEDLDTGYLQINSPQLFRVMIKWAEDLSETINNPKEKINANDSFKSFVPNASTGNYIFNEISPYQVGDLAESIQKKIQELQTTFKNENKQLFTELDIFNAHLLQLLNKSTRKQKYVPEEETKIIKFSSMNVRFISYILAEKLIKTIKILIEVGKSFKNQNTPSLDLIKFRVSDLMRCMVFGNRDEMLKVYKNFQDLEEAGEIQIIKIKNRFSTPLNDAMIIFTLKDSFIICQAQLILKHEAENTDIKAHNIEILNHFFYELQRSHYGVLAQIAINLAYNDSKSAYDKEIQFETRNIEFQTCLQKHKNTQKERNAKSSPFVCSKCFKYYSKSERWLLVQSCRRCQIMLCANCVKNSNSSFKNINVQKIILLELERLLTQEKTFFNRLACKGEEQKMNRSRKSSKDDEKQECNSIWNQKEQENGSQLRQTLGNQESQLKDQIKQEKKDAIVQSKTKPKAKNNKNSAKSVEIDPLYIKALASEVLKFLVYQNFKIVEHFSNNKVTVGKLVAMMKKYEGDRIFFIANFSEGSAKLFAFRFRYQNGNGRIDHLFRKGQVLDSHLNLKFTNEDLLLMPNPSTKVKQDLNAESDLFIFGPREKLLEENKKKYQGNFYLTFEIKDPQSNKPISLVLDYDYGQDYSKKFQYQSLDEVYNKLPHIKGTKKNLDFSDLGIQTKHLNFFSKKKWTNQLREINLSKNNLNSIQQVLKVCVNIQKLYLHKNSIQSISIPPEITKLQIINASQNKLVSIEGLKNVKNIRKIILSDNYLTRFQMDSNIETPETFPQLIYLDLSKNDLKDFPLLKAENLEFLILDNNIISEIGNLSKCTISKISKLALCSQKIRRLPKLTCFQIRQLDFSKNKMTDIVTLSESTLAYIQSMNFQINSIKDFPKLDLQTVKYLNFSQNLIVDISQLSQSHLPNVLQLNFSYNSIQKIPLLNLVKVEKLDFSLNVINDISNLKQSVLPNLQQLNLSYNKIETVPSLQLNSIKKIDFKLNRITDIQDLQNSLLPRLEDLNFYTNKIKKLPPLQLSSLKFLQLTQNHLEDIDQLKNSVLNNLEKVNLFGNRIEKIPRIRFKKLGYLDVSFNRVKDLSQFAQSELPGLHSLILNENRISEFPQLSFEKLEVLSLMSNQIENIHNIQQSILPYLERLNLGSNRISKVPLISNLTRLNQLILEGNPITETNGLTNSYNIDQIVSLILTLNVSAEEKSSIQKEIETKQDVLNFLKIDTYKI